MPESDPKSRKRIADSHAKLVSDVAAVQRGSTQEHEAEAQAQRAEELAAAKRANEADAAIETGSVVTPEELERTCASIDQGATWQEPEPEPEPEPEMWHVVLDLGTMDAEKLDEVKKVLRTTGIKEALHGIGAECRLMRGRA